MSVPEDPRTPQPHGTEAPEMYEARAAPGEAVPETVGVGPGDDETIGVGSGDDETVAVGSGDDGTAAADGDPSADSDSVGSDRPTIALPYQRRFVPPSAPKPPPRPKRPPLPIAATVNALWAAIVTLVPMLVVTAAVTQIGGGRPSFAGTLRFALAGWLLGYGVPLRIGGYPLAIVPLLLTVFAWWRIVRAGRHTVRAMKARGRGSWAVTAGASVAIGIPYALLGLIAALVANRDGIGVSPMRAAVTLGVFAAVAAGLGAGAATGATRKLWWRVPPLTRDGVRAGAVGALLLLGAGGLAAGVAVAAAGGDAADMLHRYHTGVVGQAALVLICLVYAPNVAVWATAFLAGPGFTLAGAPALPVFAGLPDRPLTGAAQLVLAVPVLAGAGAGLAVMRKRGVRPRMRSAWWFPLVVAVEAGTSAGVGLSLAGWVASGSLGTGLLADMGQVGWQFPVIAGIGVSLGAYIGINLDRVRHPA